MLWKTRATWFMKRVQPTKMIANVYQVCSATTFGSYSDKACGTSHVLKSGLNLHILILQFTKHATLVPVLWDLFLPFYKSTLDNFICNSLRAKLHCSAMCARPPLDLHEGVTLVTHPTSRHLVGSLLFGLRELSDALVCRPSSKLLRVTRSVF